MMMIIKNVFRWDVIANFIEEHSRGKFKRTGKEVLNKTKELQKLGKFQATKYG
jgi:hypothetical protein